MPTMSTEERLRKLVKGLKSRDEDAWQDAINCIYEMLEHRALTDGMCADAIPELISLLQQKSVQGKPEILELLKLLASHYWDGFPDGDLQTNAAILKGKDVYLKLSKSSNREVNFAARELWKQLFSEEPLPASKAPKLSPSQHVSRMTDDERLQFIETAAAEIRAGAAPKAIMHLLQGMELISRGSNEELRVTLESQLAPLLVGQESGVAQEIAIILLRSAFHGKYFLEGKPLPERQKNILRAVAHCDKAWTDGSLVAEKIGHLYAPLTREEILAL